MSEKKTSQAPTLFAVDSPVKMFRSLGKGRGLRGSGQHSGRSSIVSFAKFTPDGSLSKTSQGYSQVTMYFVTCGICVSVCIRLVTSAS